MICRDVLEAEQILFGDYGRNLGIRKSPGGEDRIDDLAQAWIDGDRDRVLEYAKKHEERVREQCARLSTASEPSGKKRSRRRRTDYAKVLALRAQGHSLKQIALEMGVSMWTVHRIARKAPGYKRIRSRVPKLSSQLSATS